MLRLKVTNPRGATLVEFALVLPIFLIFVFAIVDFGWYFFVSHTLEFATREGTRFGLVGAAGGSPAVRAASIQAMIRNHVSPAIAPGSTDLTIHIFPVNPDYSNPDPLPPNNAGNPGDYMRVVTTYSYSSLTPLSELLKVLSGGTDILNLNRPIMAQTLYRNELF